MKNFKILTLLMAMMVLVLAACGGGDKKDDAKKDEPAKDDSNKAAEEQTEEPANYPITIEQPEGFETVTLEKMPEKVAVFDFGFLDTLDSLGVEIAAAPKKSLPEYLKKFEDDKYTNLGSLKEPDFETIDALKPDVIFISGRQSDAYEELNKIAPTIYVGVDSKDYVNSFKHNSELAGKIFDKEEEVEKQLTAYDEKVAEIKTKAEASGKKAMIVLGSSGELFAYGPGGRFGVIHDVYGLTPADAEIEAATHGDSVSFEYILDKNPDMLFVIDRDKAIGQDSKTSEAVENEIVNKTNAAKNGEIYYLDPAVWYLSGGGLVSEMTKLESVEAAFKE